MKYIILGVLVAISVGAMVHAEKLQPASPVIQATSGLGATPSELQGSDFQLQP